MSLIRDDSEIPAGHYCGNSFSSTDREEFESGFRSATPTDFRSFDRYALHFSIASIDLNMSEVYYPFYKPDSGIFESHERVTLSGAPPCVIMGTVPRGWDEQTNSMRRTAFVTNSVGGFWDHEAVLTYRKRSDDVVLILRTDNYIHVFHDVKRMPMPMTLNSECGILENPAYCWPSRRDDMGNEATIWVLQCRRYYEGSTVVGRSIMFRLESMDNGRLQAFFVSRLKKLVRSRGVLIVMRKLFRNKLPEDVIERSSLIMYDGPVIHTYAREAQTSVWGVTEDFVWDNQIISYRLERLFLRETGYLQGSIQYGSFPFLASELVRLSK